MLKKFTCLTLIVLSFTLNAKSEKKENKSRFENLELFNKVLHLIENSYYRDIDNEKLILGALKGMMDTLDPHSAFLPKSKFKKMQNDTAGEFGGLGLEVSSKKGHIYVISPIDDTPAFKAGIKAGDKIVEINGESTLGMTLDEAIEKIKGKVGTKITIGIVRKDLEGIKRVDIVRRIIKVKPVKFQLLANNYGYLRLTQFTKKASSSVVSGIKKLKIDSKKHGGLKGLVLDLRANPGGLLDEAVNVSSIFLKDGIVVSTEGRDPKNKEIRYVNKQIYKETELPLVVLINGASASASEIVAGALQDFNRAIILGSQSFGKGSVQQVAKIDKDNGIKLTVAQYMTPKNRKIQAIGIKPDIVVADISMDVVEKHKKNDHYIREVDLKNHLVSYIETPEEKKLRVEKERKDKMKRLLEIQESKKSENEEEVVKRYDPENDYQVEMAVKYLKAVKVFQKL